MTKTQKSEPHCTWSRGASFAYRRFHWQSRSDFFLSSLSLQNPFGSLPLPLCLLWIIICTKCCVEIMIQSRFVFLEAVWIALADKSEIVFCVSRVSVFKILFGPFLCPSFFFSIVVCTKCSVWIMIPSRFGLLETSEVVLADGREMGIWVSRVSVFKSFQVPSFASLSSSNHYLYSSRFLYLEAV